MCIDVEGDLGISRLRYKASFFVAANIKPLSATWKAWKGESLQGST